MSDFGNTTGTSNPIFRIMSQQEMGNNQQMNNSMALNVIQWLKIQIKIYLERLTKWIKEWIHLN